MTSKKILSFSEERISHHAFVVFILAIVEVVGLIGLVIRSALCGGEAGIGVGLIGCIFMVVALSSIFWGLLHFDEPKTSNTLKIPGILMHIAVLFIGIALIML